MNALTNVPPAVRTACYLIGWLAGTIAAGITVVWAAIAASSPDVSMPIWLVIVGAGCGFLGSQFNLLASANVPEAIPARGQRGEVSVVTVLVVVLIVILILVLLGAL